MPENFRSLDVDGCAAVTQGMFAPSDEDLFGLECEWPTYVSGTPDLRAEPAHLEGYLGAIMPAGGRITLEPGGQIELSSAPHSRLSAAITATARDEMQLRRDLARDGIDLGHAVVDLARQPRLITSAGRYVSMARFWRDHDAAGPWMMCNTTSVQVNVSNGRDPAGRWAVSNAIGPLLVAIFANSGGRDRAGVRWESLRQGIWSSMEPLHTRALDIRSDPAAAWLDRALSADVFHVPSLDGMAVLQPRGLTFGQWMANGAEFGWPTVDDFHYHLTTIFPPVRPKGWIEMRMIDALPRQWRAAAAVTVAIATCGLPARAVLDELPSREYNWTDAARRGMHDAQIQEAAMCLMSLVVNHLHTLDVDAAHADALLEYVSQYTARGTSPSFLQDARLPVILRSATTVQVTGRIDGAYAHVGPRI